MREMLLVIDCGNTNTLFAVRDGEKPVAQWRISTSSVRTADEYISWLNPLLTLNGIALRDIKDCVISTVVPQSLFHLRNLCRRYFEVIPMVVGETPLPIIKINIDNPNEAGADRLVNALGGYKKYGGPLLIIDSGTATTFDVISADGAFEGGVICPGLSLSVLALHNAAAKLPRVEIKETQKVIGKNTIHAMQAGIFWGYVGLIEGLITRIKAEYGENLMTVATGGIVPLFEGVTEMFDYYDQDLTVCGLLEVYESQKKNRNNMLSE